MTLIRTMRVTARSWARKRQTRRWNPLRCVRSGVSPIHSLITNRSHNGIKAPKIFDTLSCFTNIYRIHSATHGTRHTCRHHCLMVCSRRFRHAECVRYSIGLSELPRRTHRGVGRGAAAWTCCRGLGVVLQGMYGEDGAKKVLASAWEHLSGKFIFELRAEILRAQVCCPPNRIP